MHLAVYLPLLAPLAAVVSAGRLARRLDPRPATWLLTCSAVAQLSAAANPLLRPLARAVAFTIERWADEDASTAAGDRNLVAHTIAKAALVRATSTHMAVPGSEASFALGVTSDPGDLADLSSAGAVPRRVAALLTAPPQRRLILVIGVTVVLAATGLCTPEALRDLHQLLESASV